MVCARKVLFTTWTTLFVQFSTSITMSVTTATGVSVSVHVDGRASEPPMHCRMSYSTFIFSHLSLAANHALLFDNVFRVLEPSSRHQWRTLRWQRSTVRLSTSAIRATHWDHPIQGYRGGAHLVTGARGRGWYKERRQGGGVVACVAITMVEVRESVAGEGWKWLMP